MITARLRGGRGSGPLSQAVHFATVPVIQDFSKSYCPGGAGGGFIPNPCRRVKASKGRVSEGRVFQVGELVLGVGRGGCRLFRAALSWQGSLGGSILARLAASLAVGLVRLPTVCAEGRVGTVLGCNGLSSARTAETAVVASQVGRCTMDAAR